jgi:hypothetical protein
MSHRSKGSESMKKKMLVGELTMLSQSNRNNRSIGEDSCKEPNNVFQKSRDKTHLKILPRGLRESDTINRYICSKCFAILLTSINCLFKDVFYTCVIYVSFKVEY